MLFGLSKTPPPPAHDPAGNAVIFDVTTADFEERVMRASMDKPVIVDFWAPWCGPCKQLMPALEKAVMAAGGAVTLAKVNLDDNPELAQALRVQSVPTVFAFFGGRPVDAFQGVISQSQMTAFIDKLVQAAKAAQPDAIDIPEALKTAAQLLAAGDLQTANQLYAQILGQDENNAAAYAGLVRTFIAAGQLEQAQGLIAGAPDSIAKTPDFAAAATALDLAQNAPDQGALHDLQDNAQNKDDHQAQIDWAEGLFAAGRHEQAIVTLIGSIQKDREWNDGAARKALLKIFEALGHADPLTVQGRKKLSSVLFS
ncbi:MAG: tetratricopeptide repeat protein [Bdellovibrionales bacterium]